MAAMLVDTHAHLCSESFDADRHAVLDRAEAAGIGRVVAVGETLADAEKTLRLAALDPRIRPAAGLFPTELDEEQAEAIEQLLRAERDRFVAIGEVGLDFFIVRDPDERELQRRIFLRFVHLAAELDLPINVHSRSTGHQTVDLLLEAGARRVHLHAFDGKHSHALRAVAAGYKLSIPPSIVRSQQKQNLVAALPLEALLLETDSPVLGPDREARNEPANAMVSLREIARIQQLDEATVRDAIEENTRAIYGAL